MTDGRPVAADGVQTPVRSSDQRWFVPNAAGRRPVTVGVVVRMRHAVVIDLPSAREGR